MSEIVTKVQALEITERDFIIAKEVLDEALEEMHKQSESIVIVNDSGKEDSLLKLKDLKTVHQNLESKRKELISEPQGFIKRVNSFFKEFTERIGIIDSNFRRNILGYERECQKAKEEAERKAREIEERNAKRLERMHNSGVDTTKYTEDMSSQEQANAEKVQELERPKSQKFNDVSSTIRKEWAYEIEDITQVPRDYFTLNHTFVMQSIRAGNQNIPGLRIFQKELLVVRKP